MVDQMDGSLGVDPARFEVVKNALHSAAEEMKIVLAKTAFLTGKNTRRAPTETHTVLFLAKTS